MDIELEKIKQGKTFDKLRELITSGYFRPGENLSEREIAEMLKVSRTPVRDAFRKLETEGLVIYEPKRGVTIPSFSMKEIFDLYRVREYVEGLSARIITEIDNQEILKGLRENLHYAKAAAEHDDIRRHAKINDGFHELMALGTQNKYLMNIVKQQHSQTSLLRSRSLSYQGRSLVSIKEHTAICDAIESGNPDLAEEAARIHVKNSLKTVLAKLNNPV
jgi:DNA-binding GntR family transcriptional regulator